MRLRSRTINDRPSLAQFNDNGQRASATPRPRRTGKRNLEKVFEDVACCDLLAMCYLHPNRKSRTPAVSGQLYKHESNGTYWLASLATLASFAKNNGDCACAYRNDDVDEQQGRVCFERQVKQV